jgi:photosynthetic reaction center H subunit
VIGADGLAAGTVSELWLDRSEYIFRYIEVALEGSGQTVLLPLNLAVIDNKAGQVRVESILSTQFADVPMLKNPDQITLLEEDKVVAYYGGGTMYATPARGGPIL